MVAWFMTKQRSEERMVLSINGAEPTGHPHGKQINLDHYLTLHRKPNPTWNADLNGKNKVSELLEKNIEKCVIETKATT